MFRIKSKTSPLCIMPNGTLVSYRYGRILLYKNGRVANSYYVFKNIRECILGRMSLLYRLLRLGIRTAIVLDDDSIILSIGNWLYEFDISKGILSNGFYVGKGIRPLILTKVASIGGFNDSIVFGGYLGNMNKKPVNIYRRINIDNWEIVYTFPQGAINHVHNIVADPYRNCLWAFTGDFEEASAIWKITDNFNKVERVVCNDQKYRGCVAYSLPEGLLYATDAPFANDYIYLLYTDTMECQEFFPIEGSCIYGCQWKDKYVFSSTVEGDGRDMSIIEWLFTRKRGAGIKDDFVHLYMGNIKEGFKEIYRERKDSMPYYPFQFGVFKFPYGMNNTEILYFQPIATKRNDLFLMSYINE